MGAEVGFRRGRFDSWYELGVPRNALLRLASGRDVQNVTQIPRSHLSCPQWLTCVYARVSGRLIGETGLDFGLLGGTGPVTP